MQPCCIFLSVACRCAMSLAVFPAAFAVFQPVAGGSDVSQSRAGAGFALTLAASAALLYIVVLHGALSVLHTGFELANTEAH